MVNNSECLHNDSYTRNTHKEKSFSTGGGNSCYTTQNRGHGVLTTKIVNDFSMFYNF